ncbi:hypothetical protein D187_008510 [Cystobacter fuscus DSM 2262]|uniref:Uncharacterized protein n=1 Tax=Cystobacter fuscus (strain ATCC 25194 / DSM 2262 / NBRC 100088 / M29) TaxID=1242864 RepID=S9R086_CYSF2|nr:hypothetical protein [Cystobacter fuscus]EPX62323.1 hypothetical protein D187_008510 [Cystobacter fuscus DSM 2262]
MQLRLQLPKRQFLVTEELTLQVTLVNEGPTAVELPDPFHSNNWQPVYHLTGPTQAEQATFTFRSAVSPDKRLVPEGAAPVLTRLEAGGRLESEVPLHDWARLSKPGTYQLTASLDWQGLSARSEPIDFTLAPLSVGMAALGLEETASSTGQVWVHWIHREGDTGHLYETMFVESRPDLGEVEPHSVSDVGAVGPPTVQPLSAWTNTDRMELLGVWRAWSDGATVFALPSQTPARQQLRLDAPPALIVRPALMPPTGELDMFVIPPGKNEVTLARFRPSEDAAPSGSRVGHVSLPAPIQSARAALGSPEKGNVRYVVLTTQEEGQGLSLHTLHTERGGTLGATVTTVPIPGAWALTNSEPGLWIDKKGALSAAVLVSTDPAGRDVALAEVHIGHDGKAERPALLTPIGRLPAAARAAVVRFSVSQRRPGRQEWVILLENGEFLSSGAPDQPQRPRHPPVLPLEVAPLSQATYLLTLSASDGPQLELLR